MTAQDRVPSGANAERAPTTIYEVWDWFYGPEGCHWRFIGYRTLSLRQVLRYQDFGYHVERSRSSDCRDLVPLFPRLDTAGEGPGNGLD